MKYIVIKSGHRYVRFFEDGSYKLVRNVNAASTWPVDMEPYVEEGIEAIMDNGSPWRITEVVAKPIGE